MRREWPRLRNIPCRSGPQLSRRRIPGLAPLVPACIRQGIRVGAVFLPLCLLLLSMLACGGFQVRVTPTPTTPTTATPELLLAEPTPTDLPTPVPIATLTPSATPTISPQPGGLAVGAKARVAATGGLNLRDQATAKGKQLGKLGGGAIVTLIAGPAQADNYAWWQVDDGAGLVGWVAAGPPNDPWLVPQVLPTAVAGNGKLVNRPVRLGDRVQVTTDQGKVLAIRESAGKGALALANALGGTQFIVRGGPVRQDGLLWWQLEGEKVNGWAAEGSGEDRWLTPIEP